MRRSPTGRASAAAASSGDSPSSRGSVISPRSAVAAAVAGEQRYTRSSGRAAAAGEVPVERPHRHGARRRRLAHADARPARGLENPSARGKGVGVDAAANEQVEDLAEPGVRVRSRCSGKRPSAEDGRDESDVLERRVDRAADADLARRRARRSRARERRCPERTAVRSAARARPSSITSSSS